jgi:hypothetical protein
MNKSDCVLRLRAEHFNSDVVCLGFQFKKILQTVKQDLIELSWFAADIDAFQELPLLISRKHQRLQRVGDIDRMFDILDDVGQFISGTFVASSEDVANINYSEGFSTTDPSFRKIPGAFFEVRTFDTSYFEIYCAELKLLQVLSDAFGADIECL